MYTLTDDAIIQYIINELNNWDAENIAALFTQMSGEPCTVDFDEDGNTIYQVEGDV